MITTIQYFNANKNCILKNSLCFYLWHDKTIKEHMQKIFDYEKTQYFIDTKQFETLLNNFYKQAAKDKKIFIKALDEERKTLLKPCYKTLKSYIKNEIDEVLTVNELYELFKNEVYKIFKEF